jgi:hypothetical protein
MKMAFQKATFQFSSTGTLGKTMREASPFHGIMISSLMEPRTNHVEMMVVDNFLANGIPMFSLMELKTNLVAMMMVDNFLAKDQGIC